MTATNVNANDEATRVPTPVTPTSTEQEAKEAASAGPAPFVATETSLAEDSTDRQQINQTEQQQQQQQTSSTTRPDDLERKPSRLAALKTTKEHWLQKETQIIPKNNLPLCFAGLMLCVALSALDQTIVSTALPTIAFDLNANGAGYSQFHFESRQG